MPIPHQSGSTGDYAAVIGDGRPLTLDHHPALAASLGLRPGVGPFVHAQARCWGTDPDFRSSGDTAARLFVSFASLSRGLSHTLLIGEKDLAQGDTAIWNPDNPLANGRMVPSGFASAHAVPVWLFADGRAEKVKSGPHLAPLAIRD